MLMLNLARSTVEATVPAMKIRFFTLVFAFVLAAASAVRADDLISNLVAQISANPAGAAALVADAVSANRGRASDIFKAAYAAVPDQTLAIMNASILKTPSVAPQAAQYAITQLTTGAATPEAAAATAASVTQTAISTSLPTQSTAAAQAKLAAAIAGAAVRALPGASDAVSTAAAQALPSAASLIQSSINSVLAFPPQPPPVVVSPSS